MRINILGISRLFAVLCLFQSSALLAQGHPGSEAMEVMKKLAGSWSGPTYKHMGEKVWAEEETVVTYELTGAGSAVIETLFPGKSYSMTTVYHDDSAGHLVMTHYCNAGNQPKMELASFANNQLVFKLAADADIDVEHEHHAHELTITLGDDGSLQHDWTNFNKGESADQRNIKLVRMTE